MSSRSQYWQWSKPSLVLAVFSAVCATASVWTQGYIDQYYRRILAGTLEKSSNSTIVTVADFRRAELAVKRLMQQNGNTALLRLESAELASAASALHASRAYEFRQQGNLKEAAAEMESHRAAMRRLTDSIRRASKSGGELAGPAQLWLLDDSTPLGPLAPHAWDVFWTDMASQVAISFMEGGGSDDASRVDRVRLEAMSAISLATGTVAVRDSDDRTRRRVEIENAMLKLSDVWDQDPRCYMLHLEGLDCVDSERAVSTARARIKDLLDNSSKVRGVNGMHREMERIDAIFVSLLVLGSADEAIAYAMNVLDEESAIDPEPMRGMITQSLLRGLGRNLWFPDSNQEHASKRLQGLIRGLFLVGNKYPPVLELVDRVVRMAEGDSIARHWSESLAQEQGTGVGGAVCWLRHRLASSNECAQGENEISLSGVDEELARPMLAFLGYLIREEKCTSGVASGAVDEMVARWPAIGELRLAQAMVATQMGQYDRAIETLSELNDKFPNNPQIQDLLLQAYESALNQR